MEKIEFKVKNGRDIAFVGKEVAYEHDPVQDVAYRIYETEKGNWIFVASPMRDIFYNNRFSRTNPLKNL